MQIKNPASPHGRTRQCARGDKHGEHAGKPWKFKDLTVKQVYTPLARSNGKILALTREQKAASDDSHAKLHQFLSEIGTKALRTHLGQLLGIAQVSENREEYERHVTKVFGGQISLDFEGQG